MTLSSDGLRALVVFEPAAEPFEEVADAAAAQIDRSFASGVRQITWRAAVGDVASLRVAWACGFTFHGVLPGDWVVRGRMEDAWVGTLLAGDSREPKARWLAPVRLTGAGVVLREPGPADEVRFLETVNDDRSLQWLGTLPLPRTSAAFRQMLARQPYGSSIGASVAWTIAAPVGDTYLGSIQLFGMGGLDYLSAEVGYRIHPDARGRGVMTTALRRVITHAFQPTEHEGLGLERISLGAGAGNTASQRVAWACGFTETGRDRRCYELHDGTVVDLVRFDLLASEWHESRAGA